MLKKIILTFSIVFTLCLPLTPALAVGNLNTAKDNLTGARTVAGY